MRIRFFVVMLGVVMLPACSGTVYNTKALQGHNRFGVVSVTGTSSGFGFSSAEETKLLTTASHIIMNELRTSKRFQIVSPELVKRDRNYVAIKGESTDGLLTLKVADGYKKFDPSEQEQVLTGLRKDLKLTGVIYVTLGFSKTSSGVSLSGLIPVPIPVSAGKVRGEVNETIVAYDANNQVIWSDTVKATTRGSVTSVMGLSNIQSLHPQLLDAVRDATQTALKNLEESLKN